MYAPRMAHGLLVESLDPSGNGARFGIRPGDRLVSLNGSEVNDEIDLLFHFESDESNELEFAREGDRRSVTLPAGDAGIEWRESEIRLCSNKCVFCYVHQNRKGMRKAIYVMDEDIRLSFLYGGFTTLSNLTDADRNRIIAQRLSPLYVSVHATDELVRASMLRARSRANPTAILDDIDFFVEKGIELHTQAVICPGINDGEVLERTINDLAARRPVLRSLACVPVGLTGHRKNLPLMRPFDTESARVEIARIERLARELDEPFVYAADEFYCIVGIEPPPLEHYGDWEQLDNGVGLIRYWEEIVREANEALIAPRSPRRVLALTGVSARSFVGDNLAPAISDTLEIRVASVRNTLFGESVTVANLLSGEDLLRGIERSRASGFDPDLVLLPPKILNEDQLFLDDLPFGEARALAATELLPAPEDPSLLAEALGYRGPVFDKGESEKGR